ncbi:MAG: 1-acyl-sn-glycerol-3-phosphate acyltransferase [Prochloraceae cyanobacterium]|nr:1-acyl-sn-glycerol-3-phosphate acyltransferase [Prochloraceae cyanobacterium]
MSSRIEKTPEFYPPQQNPIVVRLGYFIASCLARWFYRIKLEIAPKDLEKLVPLKTERLVILPNHVTLTDWIIIFLLSTRMQDAFHFLAAKEAFRGLVGKFMQQIGVYSIRRGVGDRASVAYTIELLMQPGVRLVIFPEGGCSYQNDTVMPFRSGAIQLPLQAMNKMVKQGNPVPDLYLVPISLKYRYLQDMTGVIQKILSQLESRLNISKISDDSYERLRAVAEKVLHNLEREYELERGDKTGMDWNQRIEFLKDHVLKSCEQKLEITPPPNSPPRERVYRVQSVLETRAEELPTEGYWTYESISKSTIRLLNFDAIYDGYVAANPTPERFMDTLTRLEREVFSFDRPPAPKSPRKAILRIGDPVNLKDYFQAYKENKASTVESLTQQIQQIVQKNLDEI